MRANQGAATIRALHAANFSCRRLPLPPRDAGLELAFVLEARYRFGPTNAMSGVSDGPAWHPDSIAFRFPPTFYSGEAGVEFGLQGAQFTATSTTAHNQTLGFPMSLHSISCNKDNQDIVSMGSDCALIAADAIENCAIVAAIQALACKKACEILGLNNDLSPASQNFLTGLFDNLPVNPQNVHGMSPLISRIKDRLMRLDIQ